MDAQSLFKIVVVLYSVSNLLSLGIELNLKETIRSLKSFRLIILTLGWGWVVSPAFAWLLTKIIPMDPSIALGLLITSLAPVAPFFPILVRNARADVNFSAAFMPLAMVAACRWNSADGLLRWFRVKKGPANRHGTGNELPECLGHVRSLYCFTGS